jgi:hypothetical protein
VRVGDIVLVDLVVNLEGAELDDGAELWDGTELIDGVVVDSFRLIFLFFITCCCSSSALFKLFNVSSILLVLEGSGP